jgi:putative ABC transport system substrate-binding protein
MCSLSTNNVAIRAAKELTKTIPIVMRSSIDPVIAGYVDSFAHPGGNITGIASMSRELSGKRLELFHETIPKMTRLGALNTAGPGSKVALKEYQSVALKLKLDLQSLEVHGPSPDFERVFKTAKSRQRDALIVIGSPLIRFHQKRIMDLAIRDRLPSMSEDSGYVDAGALISYGPDIDADHRRLAYFVDKILKGVRPADIPVEQPLKFELAINLKTAKQIGLTIPPSVLYQADRVNQVGLN